MKSRHASALALLGWYLMVPQVKPNTGKVDFKAPLAQWNQMGAFDTATACEKERDSRLASSDKAVDELNAELKAVPDKSQPLKDAAPKVYEDYVSVTSFVLEMKASRCIASDDPRLKEK